MPGRARPDGVWTREGRNLTPRLPDPGRLPVIVVPTEIATIGDMPNDILMFADTGLSIAMGNADSQVKRAARHVTDTNDNNGFAWAMECFVLADAPAQDG